MAVFKGFAGNRIVDGFLLVAQWQLGRNDDGHEFNLSTITLTQATSITPATNAFIKTPINHSIGSDWAATAIDRNGSLRIALPSTLR
jgi:hypothetical protein